MAYKQKPITFGDGTGLTEIKKNAKEKGPKFNGLKKATPPMANAMESEDKEQEIENKTNDPGTVPLFSDDAHDKVKVKKKKGPPNMKTGKYKHNF